MSNTKSTLFPVSGLYGGIPRETLANTVQTVLQADPSDFWVITCVQDPRCDLVRPSILDAAGTHFVVDRRPGRPALPLVSDVHKTPSMPTCTFRFQLFEHPYVEDFVEAFNRQGVDGLFSAAGVGVQGLSEPGWFPSEYSPTNYVSRPYPGHRVEFEPGTAYGEYNWELFFHVPTYLAKKLTSDGKYEAAQSWLRRVFDPTVPDADEDPTAVWKFAPFREQSLMVRALGRGIGEMQDSIESIRDQVAASNLDPFDPHHIARLRSTAYQRAVLMQYVDNLIAWGDSRFSAYTAESINEATLHYVTAARILGPRPVVMPAEEPVTQMAVEDLVGAGNGVPVEFEAYTATNSTGTDASTEHINEIDSDLVWLHPHFKIPFNGELLRFWDTVGDRLHKIRHCLDINGQHRDISLFAPPIDPAMLVRAAASGLSIAEIMDLAGGANDGFYRFSTTLSRAKQACGTLKDLGGRLAQALERRDAETVAEMRLDHEAELLALRQAIAAMRIDETKAQIESLQARHVTAATRAKYYSSRPLMNAGEATSMAMGTAAGVLEILIPILRGAAAVASAIPTVTAGGAGAFGSPVATVSLGKYEEPIAQAAHAATAVPAAMHLAAGLAGTMGSYRRREDDWKFQETQARQELLAIERDLEGAEIRVELAEAEAATAATSLERSEDVVAFYSRRFASSELYSWTARSLKSIYRQSYRHVLELVQQAERQLRNELRLADPDSVAPVRSDAWEGNREGLLSGDRMYREIERLEDDFHRLNQRFYQVSRNIPLSQVAPEALLELRVTGACTFEVGQGWLDQGYAGQGGRRVRSVALTVSAASTAYGNVPVVVSTTNPTQLLGPSSILLSHGRRDTGMHPGSERDDRYLPFEGMELNDSAWSLSMAGATLDHTTIADVVLHVDYECTSPGSAPLPESVAREDRRVLTARADFPQELVSARSSFDSGVNPFVVEIELTESHFPPKLFRHGAATKEVLAAYAVLDNGDAILATSFPVSDDVATLEFPAYTGDDGAGLYEIIVAVQASYAGVEP